MYTIVTVAFYTVNATVELSTDNGKTTATITNKE